MNRILLGALLLFTSLAQAQLILQPLATFGTNGDGTINLNQAAYLPYDPAQVEPNNSDSMQRGMAYNPITGHLLVANRFPIENPTVAIVDAQTGEHLGDLQGWAKVDGGHAQFPINLVGVAEDGAVYVANLSSTPNPPQYYVYRWASESASSADFVFFGGLPPFGYDLTLGTGSGGGLRWGDTMAVRGSGMSTEILIAGRGTQFALLRPKDETPTSFTNATFTAPVPAGGLGYAITFGPGNTVLAKAASTAGNPTYHISYDYATGATTLLHTWELFQFPGRTGAMTYHPASNLLATIEMTAGTAPDVVRLYDAADLSAPVLLDRYTVPTWTNGNATFAGAVAWGAEGRVYALNTGNGIAALGLAEGTHSLAPVIFQQPIGKVVQITSNYVFTAGADGSAPLAFQWLFNSNVLEEATSPVLSITNLDTSDEGFYSFIVSNEFGSSTSSVAKLTVVPRFGDLVVYDPFDYAPDTGLNGVGGWSITSAAENGRLEAGNLEVPNLRTSVGNRYTLTGNTSIRKPFGEYSSGSVYCSFAFRLDTLGTGTGNETFAGLSFGTSTSFPMKINMQVDGSGGYYLGLYKGGGTTGNGQLYTGRSFAVGETVFVVARFNFGPEAGGTDDFCDFWLNPDITTFGASEPPTPTLVRMGEGFVPSAASNWSFVDRFFLRWAGGYPKRVYDEVRVGFSWAEVTPSQPPTLSISRNGANIVLSWSENLTDFVLESIAGFDDANDWQPVPEPVVIQDGNKTVTVAAGGQVKLFRLKK